VGRGKGFSFSGREGDLIEMAVPFVIGEVVEFFWADYTEVTGMLATDVLKKRTPCRAYPLRDWCFLIATRGVFF
jgi:hypothetical protein